MDKEETKVIIDSCHTAWGWVGIARSPEGLLALTLPEPTQERALRPLLERWGKAQLDDDPRLDGLKKELQQYFDGQPVLFDERLDLRGATAFQRRVWLVVRDIPCGETRSYGQVARQAGSPGAARAVGRAMAANPLPIVVPCHRVIGSGGSLRGFGGGLDLKRRLLEMEGALRRPPGREIQSSGTVVQWSASEGEKAMHRFVLPIVIEKDKDGYFVFCPALQGCYTQGDSFEEALTNIEDAIRLHIEDRMASGET